MYKILIADDEMIERKGIGRLIKSLDIDVEIIECVNGKEALLYLQNNNIDILITDIKMPFLDGIGLITKLSELKTTHKTIIISGYGEFEYAKTAMKMGVSNYILKPVNPEEFKNTIIEVTSDIDNNKIEKQIIENKNQQFKKYLLISLLNNDSIDNLIKKAGEKKQLEFLESYTKAMVLQFDEDFFNFNGEKFYKSVQELCNKNMMFLNITSQETIVFFDCDPLLMSFVKLARDISDISLQNYKKKCYIGITKNICNPKDIYAFIDEIEQKMEERFYDSEKTVFYYDEIDEENSQVRNVPSDSEIINNIEEKIKIKDIDGINYDFNMLCEKYNNKEYSQIYVKFIFTNIYKMLNENIKNSANDLKNNVEKIYSSKDFTIVKKIIKDEILEFEKQILGKNGETHRDVEAVKQYIYKNYSKNLGINDLASYVCVTPSYLSHLFKKETGENLIKFIKTVRMEKARDMLENTHEKINDIGEKVGYSNSSYFCQSFREYYGVSPQKYRS